MPGSMGETSSAARLPHRRRIILIATGIGNVAASWPAC